MHFVMLIYSTHLYLFTGSAVSVCNMSDQSDSQNKSEEQVQMSEGTSPSSSYDDGSTSTPSNLPKAATRARKKRTLDSEDEDYVAIEDEATSKKKVLKKEYGTTAATKPGMRTKARVRRIPMSKARASTQVSLESEPKEAAAEGKKRKERVKKTMARVVGKPSMMEEEEEEEVAAPTPKAQKLMGDAIRSGAASSKPKEAPKAAAPMPKSAPKRNTRNILAGEKNKALVPETVAKEEDEEEHVLRKLKPKIPDHNDAHPVAEKGCRTQTVEVD